MSNRSICQEREVNAMTMQAVRKLLLVAAPFVLVVATAAPRISFH
jgi:hypothetical protein